MYKQNNKRQRPTSWLENVSETVDKNENNNIIDKVHFYYEGGIIYNAYSIHDNFSLMSAKVQTFWR